jgi:hypothetical protein
MVGGEGRALKTSGDESTLFAVVGANVYRIDVNWNCVLLGQLTSTHGRVSAVSNSSQTLFAHQAGWHYWDGRKLQSIPDGPANCITTYMDGYVIFTDQADGEFGLTSINDVSTIDPLDIAEAEALPDNLVSVYSDQREVWLLGQISTEIWANTGALDFPFERIPGGVISTGCAARHSVAFCDGSLFWLTRDKAGNANVIRTVGYQTARVSTHAIEHEFEKYDAIDDAYAFGYQEEGHSFYVITLPQAYGGIGATWAYDAATQLWHRRGHRDSNGVLHRHRVGAYAFFNGFHCILDRSNGTLSTLELDTFTDNGDVIYRERAWPLVPPQEMNRLRCDSLELVVEAGTGKVTGFDSTPTTWLQMSFDGGVSFGSEKYQTPGPFGSRYTRLRWRRNGMGRRPVARIATTQTTKVAWLGVNMTGEKLFL